MHSNNNNNASTAIPHLPNELYFQILSYCPESDRRNLSRVCTLFAAYLAPLAPFKLHSQFPITIGTAQNLLRTVSDSVDSPAPAPVSAPAVSVPSSAPVVSSFSSGIREKYVVELNRRFVNVNLWLGKGNGVKWVGGTGYVNGLQEGDVVGLVGRLRARGNTRSTSRTLPAWTTTTTTTTTPVLDIESSGSRMMLCAQG